MPTKSQPGFAGVLARHEGHVVLVREEYRGWGGVHWNIPSGRIEELESPREGACRELAEETGLIVKAANLVLHGTCVIGGPTKASRVWNFTVDVEHATLAADDPDGLIQDAEWFSVENAVRLLRALPYRPLSEPSVAILTGEVPAGTHWAYADPEAEPVVTFPAR